MQLVLGPIRRTYMDEMIKMGICFLRRTPRYSGNLFNSGSFVRWRRKLPSGTWRTAGFAASWHKIRPPTAPMLRLGIPFFFTMRPIGKPTEEREIGALPGRRLNWSDGAVLGA